MEERLSSLCKEEVMEYLRTHGTYIEKPRWIFEKVSFLKGEGEEETSMDGIFGDFDPPDHDTLDYLLYRLGIKGTEGGRAAVTFMGKGEAFINDKARRYTAEKVFPESHWRVIEEEIIE
jgi:hypothetical protein